MTITCIFVHFVVTGVAGTRRLRRTPMAQFTWMDNASQFARYLLPMKKLLPASATKFCANITIQIQPEVWYARRSCRRPYNWNRYKQELYVTSLSIVRLFRCRADL